MVERYDLQSSASSAALQNSWRQDTPSRLKLDGSTGLLAKVARLSLLPQVGSEGRWASSPSLDRYNWAML